MTASAMKAAMLIVGFHAAISAPHAQSGLRVLEQPVQELSGSDGQPLEFGRVLMVLQLSDGGMVVVDDALHRLHLIANTGRLRTTIGRQGSGPGEFRGIAWAQVGPGDSILVWDWRLRRLSVFSPEGGLARSELHATVGARPFAQLAGGARLFLESRTVGFPFPGAPAQVASDSSRIVLRVGESQRTVVDWLGTGEVFGLAFRFRREQMLVPARRPFSPTVAWTLLGDSLLVLRPASRSIEVFPIAGGAPAVIRDVLPAGEPSTAARAHYLARLGSTAPEGTNGEIWSAMQSAMRAGRIPFPSTLPTHARLLTDETGLIWVQEPNPAEHPLEEPLRSPGSRQWRVFRSNGASLGRVLMPARLRAELLLADRIVGVYVDEGGAESVRTYRLVRP